MEGHVALDFLQRLVDVAVQHRDRAEALEQRERLVRIVRAPAPFGINRPQRNVRVEDDRGFAGEWRHVLGQPVQLLGPEHPESALGDGGDVDETDEMHALVIVAVPARTERTTCPKRSRYSAPLSLRMSCSPGT